MVKKFLRRTWNRYSKLGKGRKKKQKWRNPTGRDNKMREMRRGYPSVISVGYKKDKKLRGTLDEKKPVIVLNISDLEKLGKNEIAIIGRVGKKKKIEILKIAKEKKIEIYNFNIKKFLKENKKPAPQAYPEKSSEKISTEGKKKVEKKEEKKTESKKIKVEEEKK
ncbi:MAG: eL32 family ribosomal protein [Nanoarchaeota archaeon]